AQWPTCRGLRQSRSCSRLGSPLFPIHVMKAVRVLVGRVPAGLGGPLKPSPYRLAIVGHTVASKAAQRPSYGPWDLAAGRANAVRRILEEQGVRSAQFMQVGGKADTQPLFPDDPYIAANRRVTITLMHEERPIPMDFQP